MRNVEERMLYILDTHVLIWYFKHIYSFTPHALQL